MVSQMKIEEFFDWVLIMLMIVTIGLGLVIVLFALQLFL